MLSRTWPYGTEKTGTVKIVDCGGWLYMPKWVVTVIGDDGEGYILTGTQHRIVPKENSRVVMRFTEGGPTGGYWEIVR